MRIKDMHDNHIKNAILHILKADFISAYCAIKADVYSFDEYLRIHKDGFRHQNIVLASLINEYLNRKAG